MMVTRRCQAESDGTPASGSPADPLQDQAAAVIADQLAAGRVPSIRAIRAQLHIGQPRAQRTHDYVAAGTEGMEKIARAVAP